MELDKPARRDSNRFLCKYGIIYIRVESHLKFRFQFNCYILRLIIITFLIRRDFLLKLKTFFFVKNMSSNYNNFHLTPTFVKLLYTPPPPTYVYTMSLEKIIKICKVKKKYFHIENIILIT